jgi:hypothetical protein
MEVSGQVHSPPLYIWEKGNDTDLIGWASPREGLDAVAKRKEPLQYPNLESNPGRPASSLIIIQAELPLPFC